MPRSEIDDIFAGKAKAPAPPVASTSDAAEKKKKKSAKKRKREAEGKITADDPKSAEQPNKRRVPETVVDPSLAIAAPAAKRSKTSKADRPPEVKKKSKASKEDEERFKDSRGTGPRRTTEEGFFVYKEDELGITDQGGDTPLCPFDCQCCF